MISQKGFAAIISLALLPIGLAILVAVGATTELLQKDLKAKYICRQGSLQLMSQASKDIQNIFRLNPQARLLKLKYQQKQMALAAAIARSDAIAVAALKTQLLQIYEKRRALDKLQKILIQKSNLHLFVESKALRQRLLNSLSSSKALLLSYSGLSAKVNKVELAIIPRDSDMAPEYIPKENFEKIQTLALSWQFDANVRSPFSHFLKKSARFSKNCAASLKEKKWSPQIVEANQLSSSAW